MKHVAQKSQRWETVRALISPSLLFVILALLAALILGLAIGGISPVYRYNAAIIGFLLTVIFLLLRQDELTVMLIVFVHVVVDSYLGYDVYQIALIISLLLLFACYVGQSTDHPWTMPRLLVLWVLFFVLNIYPTINGGSFSLTNSIAFYLNLVLSAFIMFWLGNIIAKDISAVRRVFQWLSILAALFALHTI